MKRSLVCTVGHSLEYDIEEDEMVQGGILPCAEQNCQGLTGWKRAKVDP